MSPGTLRGRMMICRIIGEETIIQRVSEGVRE